MATEGKTPDDLAIELGKLRNANAELLTKKNTLKARVTELETENAALKTKADIAQQTMHKALIDAPLDKLAAEIGVVPELWKGEFLKRYNVELNGKQELELKTLDGKPVLGKDGKPLPLTYSAIADLLTGDDAKKADEASYRAFCHLVIGTRASGSGAGGTSQSPGFAAQPPQQSQKNEPPQFGLR